MVDRNELLVLRNLHVEFHLRNGILKAVSEVNLTLGSGKTIGIVGESGSGKSVMAKAIKTRFCRVTNSIIALKNARNSITCHCS